MTLKDQIITSFIKGVGKTSGAITILGIVGCTYYIYNYLSQNIISQSNNLQKEDDKENKDDDKQNKDDDKENKDVMIDLDERYEDVYSKNVKRDYRGLFDKI